MRSLDVPEALIGMSVFAMLVWAVYNWTHRSAGVRK